MLVPFNISEEQKSINGVVNNANGYTTKLININYATKEELEKLTGIGSSMAEKIITYRNEVGLFNSIEEIMNVSRNW